MSITGYMLKDYTFERDNRELQPLKKHAAQILYYTFERDNRELQLPNNGK